MQPHKTSEYDQEMPQLHTTDQLMVPKGRDTEHRQPCGRLDTIKIKLHPRQVLVEIIEQLRSKEIY